MYYIGFDIGGSNIKAVLVKNRKIVASKNEKLPRDLRGLLNFVSKTVKEFSKRREILGVGFAIAATFDSARTKIVNAYNIKYLNNKPIKQILERKLKYPVLFDNDVHCFLLAEQKIGQVKDIENVFCITLGTGVGGAFTINNRIIKGSHGSAGEIGRMIIDITRDMELEDLASNKFVKKFLGFGAKNAYDQALRGSRSSKEILLKLGQNLGIGIANVINIIDPEIVILAGGISNAKKFLEPGVKYAVRNLAISPQAKKTKVVFSKLGAFGGALGATFLFENRVQ